MDDHDSGAKRDDIAGLSSFAISYLVQGFCIGEETRLDPHEFVEDVFVQYGDDGIISEEGNHYIHSIKRKKNKCSDAIHKMTSWVLFRY